MCPMSHVENGFKATFMLKKNVLSVPKSHLSLFFYLYLTNEVKIISCKDKVEFSKLIKSNVPLC